MVKIKQRQSECRSMFDRRSLKLQILFVVICIFVIVHIVNIVSLTEGSNNRNSVQQNEVNIICDSETHSVGIVINTLNKRFLDLGGTRHWFHLLERLVSQVEVFPRFHEKLNQSKIGLDASLYIVFDKRSDVENLGPFGRLLFSSLATGRESVTSNTFEKIIFGYSTSIRSTHRQNSTDIGGNGDVGVVEEHYFQPHFIVDFKSSSSLDLFLRSADNSKAQLRRGPVCLNILSRISLDKVNTKFEWFDSSFDGLQVFRKWIFNTCDAMRGEGDRKNSTISRSYDDPQTDFNPLSSTLISEQLRISDDLNIGSGEMQRKVKRAFWKNKIVDTALKSSPIITIPEELYPLKALIYQRDSSRRMTNSNQAQLSLMKYLGSNWVVETIVHSNEMSPCEMIQHVRTAYVLITPHGFQSILLLFQPYSSVLIEIHPAYYLKQEVYGFIQAGLRQNFNLARSYLAEESVPVNFLSESLVYVLQNNNFLTHDCLHHRICRNIARRQDVEISDGFMKRSADFILAHLLK